MAVINPKADSGDEDMNRIITGWQPKNDDLYRFSRAQDGDDLLVPFKCDICIFTKLYRRLPQPAAVEPKDALTLACIRRINLDAFWSRASSTVKSNAALARTGQRLSASVGLDDGPYSQPGPLPNGDHCGYQVAIQMVLELLEEGRHSKAYKQWDTIRRLRSVYSNQFRASGKANSQAWSIADNRVLNTQRLLQDPCGSFWFSRFMEGCRRRMGQDWRPSRALSIELIGVLLRASELRILEADDFPTKAKSIMIGGYFWFFVVSLRSPEGLLADLEGLIEHYDENRAYVIIPLLGKVKGEHHTRQHLMPYVPMTDSGIHVKLWIGRLIAVHQPLARTRGPLFLNASENQATTADINDPLLEILAELYDIQRDLFDVDIRTTADL